MTTLADLPFHHPEESPATPNGARGRKACRRHTWVMDPRPDGLDPHPESPNVVCARCGAWGNPAASRRGRTSLRAGKDAERAIARAYGGKRTGMYGGPDDVVVGDLFVVQSKAGGWFSERVWAELAKLPRTGGRIPTLVISERPPTGRHARRYVVRMMADDLDLHGPSGDAA